MALSQPLNFLLISGYFKGERFMQQAHARGASSYLLTLEKLLPKPWPRELLVEVFAVKDGSPLSHFINSVSYLARSIDFDRIVALDDFDVETAAALREHLRIPGMGDSVARFFRDKLAMRKKAEAEGIPVPPYVGVINRTQLEKFMARVPAPWMFKPRSEASATGIVKVQSMEQLFELTNEKGDRQSYYVLEKYLPGDVYHVDSLTVDGKVVFSAVHRCGNPPFNVSHGGGVFSSSTVKRGSDDEKALLAINEKVLTRFGLERGASHTEFIKHSEDGKFYLLETSARVGGAHIAEMVEASSGVNLWAEWANIEIDHALGQKYTLPPLKDEYAGVLMTLARQEQPDLGPYSDPEVVFRAKEEHHAGLVVASKSMARVQELMEGYQQRFMTDFFASLPASDKPSH